MVVIRGEAMTAGSILNFSAITGSNTPINWESSTVKIRGDADDQRHRSRDAVQQQHFEKVAHGQRHTAHQGHAAFTPDNTRQIVGVISPTAMLRMMVEVLWLPALPPASVSIGI